MGRRSRLRLLAISLALAATFGMSAVAGAENTSATVQYDLGSTLLEQGNLEAAGAAYRRAIELGLDTAVSYYSLGIVLFLKTSDRLVRRG